MKLFKNTFTDISVSSVYTATILMLILCVGSLSFKSDNRTRVQDQFTPLLSGSIHLNGYLEYYIQHSISHWNKGVVPYSSLVEKFRTGRSFFAQAEMWGKAVRSGCMFYRYTQDPVLKEILKATVADLLSLRTGNFTTTSKHRFL